MADFPAHTGTEASTHDRYHVFFRRSLRRFPRRTGSASCFWMQRPLSGCSVHRGSVRCIRARHLRWRSLGQRSACRRLLRLCRASRTPRPARPALGAPEEVAVPVRRAVPPARARAACRHDGQHTCRRAPWGEGGDTRRGFFLQRQHRRHQCRRRRRWVRAERPAACSVQSS